MPTCLSRDAVTDYTDMTRFMSQRVLRMLFAIQLAPYESITIVEGQAVCRVAGKEYQLSDLDTACIPQGRPHRFLNLGDSPMEMLWVYAGDEPARRLVDSQAC